MAEPVAIESAQNPTFRQLGRLVESSRERRREHRSVIEGIHLLEAFIDARELAMAQGATKALPHLHWIFTPPVESLNRELAALLLRLTELPALPGQAGQARQFTLSPQLFRKISQLENSDGPVAVIDTPQPDLPAQLSGDTLYLDRVQDPGNVGSILRTAAAAGISTVICSPGTAFCWAPKVLRAAMGAHFTLDIHEGVAVEALEPAWTQNLAFRALVAPGQAASAQDITVAPLQAPALWLIGNEGQGVSGELLADDRIELLTIDQCAGVESMNVAAATAVALFEQRRQRKNGA